MLDEAKGLSLKKRKECLRLESVITRHNLSCLIEIAGFAKAHSLGILLETLIVLDNENIKKVLPEGKEYLMIYKKLNEILGWRFALSQKIPGCEIRENPVIWENGDMALCFIEQGNIGNIRVKSLRELWAKRLKLKERRLWKKTLFAFRN